MARRRGAAEPIGLATRPSRYWRTRQGIRSSPAWPRIVQWLETEPHPTKELFDRLRRQQPRWCSSPASCAPCSAVSATGGGWPPAILFFAGPTASPQDAVGSPIAVDARNEPAGDEAALEQDAGAPPRTLFRFAFPERLRVVRSIQWNRWTSSVTSFSPS